MNLDQARRMEIKGYEHPNSDDVNFIGNALSGGRNKIYKTFSDAETGKEEFGKTIVGKNYSTAQVISEETCPVCKLRYSSVCNCIYSDKSCENGHIWYTDREGLVKKGNPHKR
jgi:hypothetical protein